MTTTKMENTERKTNGWFILLGIVFILTGIGAFAFPLVASLSVELLVGTAFLVGGIATIVQAFQEKEWGGFFWQVAIGAIYLFGGVVFIANPFGGVVALTFMLGCVFVAEGIARMVLAFKVRPERAWGWVFASGAMSLLLGILVLAGMANGASLAFIGVLLGINFVFAGSAFVALGAGKAEMPEPHPA